jgi:hypothetical protein
MLAYTTEVCAAPSQAARHPLPLGACRGENPPKCFFAHCAHEHDAALAPGGSPLLGERGRGEGELAVSVHGGGNLPFRFTTGRGIGPLTSYAVKNFISSKNIMSSQKLLLRNQSARGFNALIGVCAGYRVRRPRGAAQSSPRCDRSLQGFHALLPARHGPGPRGLWGH